MVEYDPSSRHYTATVAGIPAIVVDAKTERTALRRAAEAIAFYLEETGAKPSSRVRAKLLAVRV